MKLKQRARSSTITTVPAILSTLGRSSNNKTCSTGGVNAGITRLGPKHQFHGSVIYFASHWFNQTFYTHFVIRYIFY